MNTERQPKYVEVVLPVPLRRAFTYRVPERLIGTIKLGARLRLPFGKRDLVGYAIGLYTGLSPELDIDESKLKDVRDLLDEEPLITPEILNTYAVVGEPHAAAQLLRERYGFVDDLVIASDIVPAATLGEIAASVRRLES